MAEVIHPPLSEEEKAMAQSKGFNVAYLEAHPGSQERQIVARALSLQKSYAASGQTITTEQAFAGAGSLAAREQATQQEEKLKGTPEYQFMVGVEQKARGVVGEEFVQEHRQQFLGEVAVWAAGREFYAQQDYQAQQRAERAPQTGQTGVGVYSPSTVSIERGSDRGTIQSNMRKFFDVARGSARFGSSEESTGVSGGAFAPPAYTDVFGQGYSYDPAMGGNGIVDDYGQGMTVMPGLRESRARGYIQGAFVTTEGPATTGTVFGSPLGRDIAGYQRTVTAFAPRISDFSSRAEVFTGDVRAYEGEVASFEAAGAPIGPKYYELMGTYTGLKARGGVLESEYAILAPEASRLGVQAFLLGEESKSFEVASVSRASVLSFPGGAWGEAKTVRFDSPASAELASELFTTTLDKYYSARKEATTLPGVFGTAGYEEQVVGGIKGEGLPYSVARGVVSLPKTFIITPAEAFIIGGGSAVEDVTRGVASHYGVKTILGDEDIKPVSKGYGELFYPSQLGAGITIAAIGTGSVLLPKAMGIAVKAVPALAAPAVRVPVGGLIGGGVTYLGYSPQRGELGETEFYGRVAGGVIGGAVVGAASTLKYESVKVPKGSGEFKTVYRSVYSDITGSPKQLVGLSETGKFYVGSKLPLTGKEIPSYSPAVLESFEASSGAAEGFVPKGVIETKVLYSESMLESIGVKGVESGKVSAVQTIIGTTETQPSAFVQKAFVRESRLGPEATKNVLGYVKSAGKGFWGDESTNFMGLRGKLPDPFAKANIEKIYGSFAAQSQMQPGTARPSVDIDIMLGKGTTQFKAETFAKGAAKILKTSGYETRVEGTLVSARPVGSTERFFHALDIHYPGQVVEGYTALSTGGERTLGYSLSQPTTKIEGVPTQVLSEQGVRKGVASVQLFKEGIIEPRPYRGKDITDFFRIQETLLQSAELGGVKTAPARTALTKLGGTSFRVLGGQTPQQVVSAGGLTPIQVELYSPVVSTPAASISVSSVSASFVSAGSLLSPSSISLPSLASGRVSAPSVKSVSLPSMPSVSMVSPTRSPSIKSSLPSFGSASLGSPMSFSSVSPSSPGVPSMFSAASIGSVPSVPSSKPPSVVSAPSLPSLPSFGSYSFSPPGPVGEPSPLPVFGAPPFVTAGVFHGKQPTLFSSKRGKTAYRPDLTSIVFGYRAKRAPKGAFGGDLFSGMELRPII